MFIEERLFLLGGDFWGGNTDKSADGESKQSDCHTWVLHRLHDLAGLTEEIMATGALTIHPQQLREASQGSPSRPL
ncbi:hypothetical protein RMSM_03597 [Rhodopirellula maiorica SM1]|uniref:Uncharacterized protein n=1 Tax=Rhodopirellula maiorica SM1 TaxID=1265738 RepID=M5RJW5_9BACT|nr:hypothetical protein RMSM_03597 [Rhodopirellula maiorica SM1]